MKKEARDKLLVELVNAPDRQLDKSMCEYLDGLIGKSDEEVKQGLKYVLDQSANGGLASDFIMTVLHTIWISLGGKVEHKPEPVKLPRPEIMPEDFIDAIESLVNIGKEQQALVEIYNFFGRHIMQGNMNVVENILADPRVLEWSTTLLLGVVIATKYIKGNVIRQTVFDTVYEKLGDRAEVVMKNLK